MIPQHFDVKTTSSARLKNLEFGPLSLTYSLILYAVRGTRREGGIVYKIGRVKRKMVGGRGDSPDIKGAATPHN